MSELLAAGEWDIDVITRILEIMASADIEDKQDAKLYSFVNFLTLAALSVSYSLLVPILVPIKQYGMDFMTCYPI